MIQSNSDSDKILLKGVSQHFNPSNTNNGRIYDQGDYSKALQEYLDKITIEDRNETIDALLEDREVKLNKTRIFNINDHDITFNFDAIKIEEDMMYIDVSYLPKPNVDFISHSIVISPTSSLDDKK